jgi:hypothetical protein
MKKILFSVICVSFCVLCSFGQLKVVSGGNSLIGSAPQDPASKLYIQHSTGDGYRGLRVIQPVASSNSNYGITSSLEYGAGGYKLMGVYGIAYRGSTATSARSYGVYGYAGNGIDGYNYGIYGHLVGTRDGAGVYGTVSGDHTNINGQYAGFFYGDVHITGDLTVDGTYPTSDINLKKDIRVIDEDVVSKLEQLQVIKFKKKHYSEYANLNSDTLDTELISKELSSDIYTRDRIGLIAQELQVTFPETVKQGNDGYLRVDYHMLIPILVKAINQQQKHIEALEAQINGEVETKQATSVEVDNNLSGLASTNTFENSLIKLDHSILFQNAPNPFTDETIIEYFVEDNVQNATINIYDMNGKQIRSYGLFMKGKGNLIINGGELEPGMYMYNMIVDGKLVNTRQMVLTE